jgi:uncharacterized protein
MIRRHLWLAGGGVCFALGWLGMVLPMMPGFVFLLAAAFCFARGSPAAERWLHEHPQFGPMLADWHQRRAIARPAKIKALVVIALGAGIAAWMVAWPLVLVPLASMTLVSTWLWTRAE